MNKSRRADVFFFTGIIPMLVLGLCLVLPGCGNVSDGFYRLRGDAYKSDGDPREALHWYSRISSNNCDETVLTKIAECYYQIDDYQGQLDAYRNLYTCTGDDAYLVSCLKLAEEQEDHTECINHAKELLLNEPDNWDYRFSLVKSMIQSESSNNVPSLLSSYEQLEAATTTNQAILGTLWHEYGNLTNAVRLMGAAVRLAPSNDTVRTVYAVYLLDNDQRGLAATNLQVVADRNPDDSTIRQMYGFALGELGQIAEAERQLRLSIHLDQHNATALNNLAYLLLLDNRGEKEALELSLSAVQLERAGYTLDTLGYAYYCRGNYDLALRYLKEAEKLQKEERKPRDPEMEFHLGLVYAELGEMQEALPRFRMAIQKRASLKKKLSGKSYYQKIEKKL